MEWTLISVWLELFGESFPSKLETVTKVIQLDTDHKKHIYQVRTSPLEHAKNNKGRLLIFTDITELKRLQMELEHQAYERHSL